MARKTDARRAELREKLIDIAEAQISGGGLSSLKARDVAKEAGCAVGAIYTHFDDMPALAMAVNGRTFKRLGRAVSGAVTNGATDSPHQELIVMSHAYLEYAAENTELWRALFDLEMSTESHVPDWYLDELSQLFALIAAPLTRIYPNKDHDKLDLSVRTLFSAVHGIVLLGLEKRISAVPLPRIKAMVTELLQEIG